MSKKLTIDIIKERCKEMHGDKYVIAEQEYIDAFHHIKVICKYHGEFFISTKNLLSGRGCKKCGGVEKLTLDEIRTRCKERGYNIPEQEFNSSVSIINVICPIHGLFEANKFSVVNGHNCACPNCSKRKKLTIDSIQKRCNTIHEGKQYIIPEQEYIKNWYNINIICPIHGIWSARTTNLLHGNGCPKCNYSKGEQAIEIILKEKNICFDTQKKFKECKSIKELLFDFYLPNHNICIEYDGKQHFEKYRFEKDNKKLIERQKRDKIKTEYCNDNNIKLFRILYSDDIKTKMNELFEIIEKRHLNINI